jgi:hypothetical protein
MEHLMILFTFSSRLHFLLRLPNLGSQVSGLKGDEERTRGKGEDFVCCDDDMRSLIDVLTLLQVL